MEEDKIPFLSLDNCDLNKLFACQLKQVGNTNSYSDLFVYGDNVYKIYNDRFDVAFQNIEILKRIFKYYNELSTVKELVLPNNILIYNKHYVGFSMPYIKGITLEKIITEGKFPTSEIKRIFIYLLDLINKFQNFPFPFAVGDLHEKNIILDEKGQIRIIDCDSFIIDNVNIFSNEKVIYGKYLANNNYTSKENSSVDYVFLLSMILNYVLSFNCNEINPIEFMLDNIKLNDITLDLLKRTTKCDFILTKKDIDALFNTSFQRIYHHENEIYVDEFKRKRKLANKL
mgnify:FL=1